MRGARLGHPAPHDRGRTHRVPAPGGAGGAGGTAGLGGGANGGGAQGTACAALLAVLTLILLRLARRPAAALVWRSPLPEVSPA